MQGQSTLKGGTRSLLAADHAVDIAEQVWFLVTGELVEFDSAPRVPAPAS